MLQFVCDYCGNVRGPNEVWINGVAAENVGTQAARREVLIDPVWRYERAVLPLAVHFCCEDCKEQYVAELFQKPVSLLEIESVTVEPSLGRKTIRARKKPATKVVKKRLARSRSKRRS
jgi:hypothetical protein